MESTVSNFVPNSSHIKEQQMPERVNRTVDHSNE